MIETIDTIDKTVRLGTVDVGNDRRVSVFCRIQYEGGRLSIVGVEGPKRNGDAWGGCGQIVMHLDPDEIDPAPGWSRESIARFLDTWNTWHLNDMNAGCQHQRAQWDTAARLEVVSYGLTTEAFQLRRKLIGRAARAAGQGEKLENLTESERALLALEDWFKDRHEPPDADSPLSGFFEVSKREEKAAGWVYPSEHPGGLLGKPCEVCGYRYGSAWLHEDVPAEVLEWLAALPETDQTPAWV